MHLAEFEETGKAPKYQQLCHAFYHVVSAEQYAKLIPAVGACAAVLGKTNHSMFSAAAIAGAIRVRSPLSVVPILSDRSTFRVFPTERQFSKLVASVADADPRDPEVVHQLVKLAKVHGRDQEEFRGAVLRVFSQWRDVANALTVAKAGNIALGDLLFAKLRFTAPLPHANAEKWAPEDPAAAAELLKAIDQQISAHGKTTPKKSLAESVSVDLVEGKVDAAYQKIVEFCKSYSAAATDSNQKVRKILGQVYTYVGPALTTPLLDKISAGQPLDRVTVVINRTMIRNVSYRTQKQEKRSNSDRLKYFASIVEKAQAVDQALLSK